MLVAAVVCPATALLVPEVAAGAAEELAGSRTACLSALQAVLASTPDLVVVVTSGEPAEWPAQPADFGRLGLPGRPADARPAALQVGRWLLDQVGWTGATRFATVDGCEPVAGGAERVAVLALADGSARRSAAAPGHLHPDAEAYDTALAAAVGSADTAALLALDPADDERLLVRGREALQALARSVDGVCSGELLWSGAPYGVGYLVARWWT